uniref:CCHC-type domain-containing protein n=1 Tax=Chenopodium quinoa TaxID=63459 RepID=A0A803MKD0_CHEQI
MAHANRWTVYQSGVYLNQPLGNYISNIDWNKAVVGRFFRPIPPCRALVQQMVDSQWLSRGNIIVHRTGCYYVFACSNLADVEALLEQHNFVLDGRVCNVRRCNRYTVPTNVNFDMTRLWIRVYGLLFGLLDPTWAVETLKLIGLVETLECDDDGLPHDAPEFRGQVLVDLSKPLIPGCFVLGEFDPIWVYFRYEGVFMFCKKCGMVGHFREFCHASDYVAARRIQSRMEAFEEQGLTVLYNPNNRPLYTNMVEGGNNQPNGDVNAAATHGDDNDNIEPEFIPINAVYQNGFMSHSIGGFSSSPSEGSAFVSSQEKDSSTSSKTDPTTPESYHNLASTRFRDENLVEERLVEGMRAEIPLGDPYAPFTDRANSNAPGGFRMSAAIEESFLSDSSYSGSFPTINSLTPDSLISHTSDASSPMDIEVSSQLASLSLLDLSYNVAASLNALPSALHSSTNSTSCAAATSALNTQGNVAATACAPSPTLRAEMPHFPSSGLHSKAATSPQHTEGMAATSAFAAASAVPQTAHYLRESSPRSGLVRERKHSQQTPFIRCRSYDQLPLFGYASSSWSQKRQKIKNLNLYGKGGYSFFPSLHPQVLPTKKCFSDISVAVDLGFHGASSNGFLNAEFNKENMPHSYSKRNRTDSWVSSTLKYQKRAALDASPGMGSSFNGIVRSDLATEGELVQSLFDASLYMTNIVSSKDSILLQLQFWKQRCKKNWILKGECPSKLLFSKVKSRQKKNEIRSLFDNQGTLQYGHTDVQRVVVNSLKETFQYDTMPPYDPEIDVVLRELDLPRFSSSQLANLDRPFSAFEI